MTVSELIQTLEAIENKDRLVVLQEDAEGNGFHELEGVDDNAVFANGEAKYERLTGALQSLGYTEEDTGTGAPCVVLFPK